MTSYQTIEANGTEVFYREGGDPHAATLLLLHGFPSSSAQYDQLMHRLAPSCHVIALDYPSFGQSRALTGTATFDRLADATDAFEADRVGMLALADLAASGKLVPTIAATFPLEEAVAASAMSDLAATDGRFPLEEGGAAESGKRGPGKVVLTMV